MPPYTNNNPLRIFSDVTGSSGNVGIYTGDTEAHIPETSGCYAWLIPLWIISDNMESCLDYYAKLFSFESSPFRLNRELKWAEVDLSILKRQAVTVSPLSEHEKTWRKLINDETAKSALESVLLISSLFMPPLYVGRSNNLKRRYREHIETAKTTDRNVFGARFTEFSNKYGAKFEVADLLFWCIETSFIDSTALKQVDVEQNQFDMLIEKLLFELVNPPFSER